MSIYYINDNAGTYYELDATAEISYSVTGHATDNPLESGESSADHYVNDPDMIKLSGVITSIKSTGANANVSKSPYDFIRGLIKLKEAGSVLTFNYGLDIRAITNCVIENLDFTQNSTRGTRDTLSSYDVSISLKKILFSRRAVTSVVQPGTFSDLYATKGSSSGNVVDPPEEKKQTYYDLAAEARASANALLEGE